MSAPSTWNSLEIMKLVVGAATPVVVAGVAAWLGVVVARGARRIESVRWAGQAVVVRRAEVYAQVAPKINRMLCFALFVGRWKETTASDVVGLKREVDELMHVNRFLFSTELFAAYLTFVEALFHSWAVVDGDALLRVDIACARGDRRRLPWWDESMAAAFDPEPTDRTEIVRRHDALGERFRIDLHIVEPATPA